MRLVRVPLQNLITRRPVGTQKIRPGVGGGWRFTSTKGATTCETGGLNERFGPKAVDKPSTTSRFKTVHRTVISICVTGGGPPTCMIVIPPVRPKRRFHVSAVASGGGGGCRCLLTT